MSDESPQDDLRLDAALADFLRRRDLGIEIDRESFLKEHAEISELLRELLEAADCIEHMAGPTLQEWQNETAQKRDEESPARASDPNESTLPVNLSNPAMAFARPNDVTLNSTRAPTNHDFSIAPSIDSDTTQPNLPCRFGDYLLEKVLGRGGMGVVYLGRQLQLERQVAVKMIRSGCFASEDEVTRFYAEARSAAKLTHRNIVTVYQCGEHGGHHFFSMDYVPGTDLARKLANGPLPPRDAARYVRDVARAIAYAHEIGILHRDLKPANVLIDERDEVVVTDFGLAKVIGSETGLTATGAALGTPSYMSPEQAAGKTDEHDMATDIYSLGAILFALLAGKPPFQAENVIQTIMQVIHKPAPPIRQLRKDLHSDLETIVSKCLHKQPQRRYSSANELAEELDRYLCGEPIQARPLSRFQKTLHWIHGIPLIAALTGRRSVDPTLGHRWAQRAIIALALLSPTLYFGSRTGFRWWVDQSLPRSIEIAAGNPGGMYHTVAGHLAKRLDSRIGNHPLVITTEGSDDNLSRLLGKKVELALLQASAVRSSQVAVVAPLYYETLHLLIRSDLAVENLTELKGMKVAMGPIHSGTRDAARLVLRQFDLSESDFQVADTDYSMLEQAKELDAAFVMIKSGMPSISNLLATQKMKLLPIQGSLEISLNEPAFRAIEIVAADYPQAGIKKPIATVATTAFLAARIDAPSKLVEVALDALYQDGIPGILSADRASHWQGLPWHPAARKYFESLSERSTP